MIPTLFFIALSVFVLTGIAMIVNFIGCFSSFGKGSFDNSFNTTKNTIIRHAFLMIPVFVSGICTLAFGITWIVQVVR
jgi:hypothetical protein